MDNCATNQYLNITDKATEAGACKAKTGGNSPEIVVFVSNKENFATFDPEDQDGSKAKPMIDLENAVEKGMEQAVLFEGGQVLVYLFKGEHYLLNDYKRYVPKAKDQHSGNFQITIA